MRSTTFQIEVQLPSREEFVAKYKPYGPWVNGPGKFLFDLLMTPENFLRARFATQLGMPAVSGVANLCSLAATEQGFQLKEDKFAKQAIGAMVCVLLEANGYEKSGESKAITHPAFTKGAVYKEKK